MSASSLPARKAAAGAAPTFLHAIPMAGLAVVLAVLPWLGLYPYILMKVLCFALFACAFNMMLGFGGLLSFGHAMSWVRLLCRRAHRKEWPRFPPLLAASRGLVRYSDRASAFRAGTRDSRWRRRRRGPGLPRGRARDPQPRHLFRHDHPRARADGLFLFAAGALYGRREWHSGRSTRRGARLHQPQ